MGKSSLIAMFLGTNRDLIRISTPVATEPLHLTPIRDVSTSTFTAKWERVDYERLSRMIARTCLEFLEIGEEGGEKGSEGEGMGDDEIRGVFIPSAAYAASKATPVVQSRKGILSHIRSMFGRFIKNLSKKGPQQDLPHLTTSLEDDPDNIQELFSNFLEGLREKVRNAKDMNEVLLSHSIRIVDSGGQPQFHEIISIFLGHISGFVSVFKLNEALSAHGEVVLYDEGQPVNDPYESHYSHEQVIRHNLQAIQSEAIQSDMEEMPNLAFVGTFLDEQEKCSETPDMKDERLHSIITELLPSEIQQCVITPGGSLKKITFRINARTPHNQDFRAVDQLKGALMSQSRAKPRDLPLKWHCLEVFLHMLMEELKRNFVSRKECEFIAHKLGFDSASLMAALQYLRELNIIAYYDVLPNVIFGHSQVVLEKITELVRYSLELKRGHRIAGGTERKFVQQGIVTIELLHSPPLSKHYISELFQPEDLLKVLISQFVLSPVGAGKFIMPCVLEVSSIYPSPPIPKGNVRSSFILHFSKKSPMFGVYCCTISALLTNAGWKLLTECGEVVQVARNSFSFGLPMDLPGTLTFLDPLSSYFNVVLELPVDVAAKYSAKLYPNICSTLFSAIRDAMKTLHYDVQVPDVSFMCPERSSRCSRIPHPAIVDDSQSYLRCSLKPSVAYPLTKEQKIWLSKAAGKSQTHCKF